MKKHQEMQKLMEALAKKDRKPSEIEKPQIKEEPKKEKKAKPKKDKEPKAEGLVEKIKKTIKRKKQ